MKINTELNVASQMIQFRDLHINDIITTYKKGNPFEELPLYTVRNIIQNLYPNVTMKRFLSFVILFFEMF